MNYQSILSAKPKDVLGVFIGIVLLLIISNNIPVTHNITEMIMLIGRIVFIGLYFAWLYIIGISLYNKLQINAPRALLFFRFNILFVVVYLFIETSEKPLS